MGFNFRPTKNVALTHLGGFFAGNKLVRLWDQNGTEVSRAQVSGSGSWSYSPVTEITLKAGQRYTVAVTLGGSGGSYARLGSGTRAPFSSNGITIESAAYSMGSGRPIYELPASNAYMYGLADLKVKNIESVVAVPKSQAVGGTERPLQSYVTNNHTLSMIKNLNWNYTMGYNFIPKNDVTLTQVGGLFSGNKLVRVWDQAGGVVAEAYVNGNNNWSYAAVTPVTLKANTQYTVAVTLNGLGASYAAGSSSLYPISTNSIEIRSTAYAYGNQRPNYSLNNSSVMYGLADIVVSADEAPGPTPRSGETRPDLNLRDGSESSAQFEDGRSLVVFSHQDDDLLWMMPFWGRAEKFILSNLPKSPDHNAVVANHPQWYQSRHVSLFGSVPLSTFLGDWADPLKRQYLVTYNSLRSRLEPHIASSSIDRIITHNPWGEYGHYHHRLLSKVVRDLAVKYRKDVWALSSKVVGSDPTFSYLKTGTLGLPFVYGSYDHHDFVTYRQAYIDRDNDPNSGHRTWTWSTGEYQYPTNEQTYIKLVNNGSDLTTYNSEVARLIKETPYYAGGYYKGEFSGTAVVAKDPYGNITSCKGPNPSDGTNYNGALNIPMSCSSYGTPSCARGFRLIKSGTTQYANGATDDTYVCEVIDASRPQQYQRGMLYGSAIYTVDPRTSQVDCSGPNGGQVVYPMSCNQSNTPVCANGFRRVIVGTIEFANGVIEKTASCESMSGVLPTEYRRGGVYGYVVTVVENGKRTYCGGPRGESLNSPIRCGANNIPYCASRFRRLRAGVTEYTPTRSEEYFVCEAMY